MTRSTGPTPKDARASADQVAGLCAPVLTRVGPLDGRPSFDRFTPSAEERERLAATLGVLLRSLRAERGLSQRVLAARSTVNRTTIERLEMGQRRPRPSLLRALAYGLDHLEPAVIAERLIEAAGESLRPDTAAGLRRRARRMERAVTSSRWLRSAVAEDADAARRAAYRLMIKDLPKIDVQPVRRHYTPEQEAAEWLMIRQTEALLNAVDAAWRRSDRLFWSLRTTQGKHPLDVRLVGWEAARFGVRGRWQRSQGGR